MKKYLSKKRPRKTLLVFTFLSSLFIIPHFTKAQNQEVRGRVIDEQQKPMKGVSVIVNNTTLGTATNDSGYYHISGVPANGTLVFSHTGYNNQEVQVGGRAVVDVTMTPIASSMDEVVAIGYATARRRDVTGAVASVKATNLEKESPRSVQDLLRGNAAGIIVGMTNDAKSTASFLVRGSGTLKASNSPLNVVDGVIFDGAFTDINPNDIESIDILKDASATAVFGARAANGVILITTKKGARGKPRITFNSNIGFVKEVGTPRVMNAEEFLKWRYDYEMGKNNDAYHQQYPEKFVDPRKLQNVDPLTWYNYDMQTPVTSVTEEELIRMWLSRLELKAPEIENYLNNKITNWQKLVFQKGFQQDYSVSVSNRNDQSNYYFSLNYVDRKGVIVGDRYKNFRTRLNLESKITSFLKVGANTNFAVRDEGFLRADWGQMTNISPFGSNNLDDPNSPFRRLPTGDPTPVNPFHDNLYRDRKDMYNTLNSSIYGIINLPLGIEFQSTYTPSFVWREFYNHESSKNPQWTATGGSSERTFEKTFNWQIDNIIRWKRRFNEHNVEVTLLQNAEKGQRWRTTAKSSQYSPSDILGYHRLQAGAVPLAESDDTYRTGDALMGRVFYSFKDRYMITASVRRDGYSAFGSQNPRATFPALAFAWDFSEEKFMSNIQWLDYSKLRLSWGRNGNREIGIYDALSDMTSGLHPYIDQNGNIYLYSQLYVNRMANLALKWEAKESYNLGLDIGLFNNRLSGSIDAYIATTKDLLVDRVLPEIIGFNSVAANLGKMENKGFEFTLTGDIIRKSDIKWTSSVIFMLNRRKIKSLYGDMIDILDENGNVIGQKEADDIKNGWFIGQDPDRYWHYERIGVWQIGEEAEAAKYGNQPGDFKYKDQNGDGILSNEDRIFQGYSTPRFRWSWRNDIDYKNFNLSFFLYSNWGQMGTFNRAANNASFTDRTTDYAMPRWTPDNPINDYARIGSKNLGNNYVERSFIRLESVALSYAVPKHILNKINVMGLRISASIRNAAVWAPKWKFGDPESGANPTPRTYNLSFNLTL